jgi:hypothetical protein
MEALRILNSAPLPPNSRRVELLERLVHLEDGVHGALDDAGDVADDVGHGHEVLVIEALLDGDARRVTSSRSGTSGEPLAPGSGSVGIAGTHATPSSSSGVVLAARQFEANVHVLLLLGLMQQIDRLAIDGDASVCEIGLGADAVQRGLFLVDDEADVLG